MEIWRNVGKGKRESEVDWLRNETSTCVEVMHDLTGTADWFIIRFAAWDWMKSDAKSACKLTIAGHLCNVVWNIRSLYRLMGASRCREGLSPTINLDPIVKTPGYFLNRER